MAKLIYELEGVRGRVLKLYDTKCTIVTKKTVGSFITGNITDGEKTFFLIDVVGVQFKKSGTLIGYLQFETSSIQMNNSKDNMFSENTFTFEEGKNGITNELMEKVYSYVVDRIEEIKYEIYDKRTTSNNTVETPKNNTELKEKTAIDNSHSLSERARNLIEEYHSLNNTELKEKPVVDNSHSLSERARNLIEASHSLSEHERKLIDAGGWQCKCGTVHANYVSSCGCGLSKAEVLNW